MAIVNESLDTINSMRASLGLPPIQNTLGGTAVAQQIQYNYTNPPVGTVSNSMPKVVFTPPSVVVDNGNPAQSSSTANAASYSADVSGGSSATTNGIPSLDSITKTLQQYHINLSKTQQRAVEVGLGVAGAAVAAYGVYKTLKGAKHGSRHKKSIRRHGSSHHRIRRRSSNRAHMVKGSLAAKRHMAKLRKMRKH